MLQMMQKDEAPYSFQFDLEITQDRKSPKIRHHALST